MTSVVRTTRNTKLSRILRTLSTDVSNASAETRSAPTTRFRHAATSISTSNGYVCDTHVSTSGGQLRPATNTPQNPTDTQDNMAEVLRLPVSRRADPADHYIKDGKVKLYVRQDINTDHWTFKFKKLTRRGEPMTGSRYVIKSTDTTNLDEAKRIASDAYETAFNAFRQGLAAHVPSFATHAKAFLADLAHDVAVGGYTQHAYDVTTKRLERVMKHIGGIALDCFSQETLTRLHKTMHAAWLVDPRRWANGGTANIQEPTSDSQNKLEGVIFRLIEHAVAARKLNPNPLASVKRSARSDGKNGWFSPANWARLSQELTKLCAMTKRADWIHARTTLSGFVHTCRIAGLRVAECYDLQVGDIDLFPDIERWEAQDGKQVAVKLDVVTLRVFGPEDEHGNRLGNKLGHKRTINVHKDLRPYLLMVLANHPDRHNRKAPLWTKADGLPMRDFDHPFGDLMKNLGMTRDDEGNKLVLGSLRHSFITEKLLAGKNISHIETYCDTSWQMIKKFYSGVLQQLTSGGVAQDAL